MHVIERPITVHYEDSDKATVFGIDILYYPEESDNKGELIKAGHYVLLRRATLLSQPENEKVYSLIMLTEKSKLSTICCLFLKILFWNFGPQKCRKLFLSKIEFLTPWVSEIANMVIAKFVFKAFLWLLLTF